ncbi:hypothetical protein JCM10296v2_000170 [Rhodotorula toruloides]
MSGYPEGSREFTRLLPPGSGYGVVVGVGAFFALAMIFLTRLQGRFTRLDPNSATEFATASRAVKPGLICCGIVSAWTWSATLLRSSLSRSSHSAWRLALVGGPKSTWVFPGLNDFELGIYPILSYFNPCADKIKQNANGAVTFPEIARARYGWPCHLLFTSFFLICAHIVTGSLVLGASATINALTGANIIATNFLLPLGIAVYVVTGGLRATFIVNFLHTVILFVILYIFLFSIYGTSDVAGSPGAMYDLLKKAADLAPVAGNAAGSYMTMKSNGGILFGGCTIASGTLTFLVRHLQASRTESTTRAYMLGGFSWFSIPWAFVRIVMGLGARAIITSPAFPMYPYAGQAGGEEHKDVNWQNWNIGAQRIQADSNKITYLSAGLAVFPKLYNWYVSSATVHKAKKYDVFVKDLQKRALPRNYVWEVKAKIRFLKQGEHDFEDWLDEQLSNLLRRGTVFKKSGFHQDDQVTLALLTDEVKWELHNYETSEKEARNKWTKIATRRAANAAQLRSYAKKTSSSTLTSALASRGALSVQLSSGNSTPKCAGGPGSSNLSLSAPSGLGKLTDLEKCPQPYVNHGSTESTNGFPPAGYVVPVLKDWDPSKPLASISTTSSSSNAGEPRVKVVAVPVYRDVDIPASFADNSDLDNDEYALPPLSFCVESKQFNVVTVVTDALADSVHNYLAPIKRVDVKKTHNQRGFNVPRKWKKMLDEHIAAGCLRPSTLPFTSAAFIIPKKDITADLRWVNHHCGLKSNTVEDRTPFPIPDVVLADAALAKYSGEDQLDKRVLSDSGS